MTKKVGSGFSCRFGQRLRSQDVDGTAKGWDQSSFYKAYQRRPVAESQLPFIRTNVTILLWDCRSGFKPMFQQPP